MPFSQTDLAGTAEAVKAAAGRGWEAAALVVLMLAIMALFVWLIRTWFGQAAERERQMGERINKLEDYQREQLTDLNNACREAIQGTKDTMLQLNATLRAKPCLWEQQRQGGGQG